MVSWRRKETNITTSSPYFGILWSYNTNNLHNATCIEFVGEKWANQFYMQNVHAGSFVQWLELRLTKGSGFFPRRITHVMGSSFRTPMIQRCYHKALGSPNLTPHQTCLSLLNFSESKKHRCYKGKKYRQKLSVQTKSQVHQFEKKQLRETLRNPKIT